MDLQGNVRTWNPAAERIFGWSEQEALGSPNPIIPEDRQNEFRALLDAVVQGNLFSKAETRRRRKDGSLIDVSLSTAAMRDATGEIVGVMSMLDDITERKRAEEALRESEQRFRKVFEEGPLGMAIIDLDYRYVKANPTLCQMVGYTEQELGALTFVDITHPEHIETDVRHTRELFSGEIPYYKVEKRYIKKNGEIIWVALTASVIRDEDGRPLYGLAMIEDVTQRKRAEEALEKAREELEARVERQMERGNPYGLTFRELTVLHVVAAGKADKEIAGQLGITTLTASKHLANILSKMGAASRTEAGVRALREGLLD
jgi:PAS domain S-box-containing protein